jgi:hypothetical protein
MPPQLFCQQHHWLDQNWDLKGKLQVREDRFMRDIRKELGRGEENRA